MAPPIVLVRFSKILRLKLEPRSISFRVDERKGLKGTVRIENITNVADDPFTRPLYPVLYPL